MEKDLLEKLNIPSLNLETLGCPKYDDIRTEMYPLVSSCGFHKDKAFIIVLSKNVTRFGSGINLCFIKTFVNLDSWVIIDF